MDDAKKSKAELLVEVHALRRQVAALDRSDDAPRASETLFAQAFRANPAAMAITRLRDGALIDVNDKFVEMLGYDIEDVIGRTSQTLGLWADPQERDRLSQLLVAQGVVREVDVKFRTKSGSLIDGRTSLVFTDLEGEACLLTLVQDVTARKRAEEAQRFLTEASAMLSTSLDYDTILSNVVRQAVPFLADWCAIDVLNEEGELRRAAIAHRDPQGEALAWELEQRYPIGLATVQRSAHASVHVIETRMAKLIPTVSPAELESMAVDAEHFRLLQGIGRESEICVPLIARTRTLGTITFVLAHSGRRYRADDLALAEDLGHRVALAVENALLYREAQQALRERDAFLSVAAHELKTPTTVVLAHAELLHTRAERDGTASERDRRALRTLSEQAHRLVRLIQAVLDVSRLQIGQFTLDMQPVDLAALARRVVEELAEVAAGHRVVAELPPSPQIVEADELRLEQVMHNLIQNALKYSAPSSVVRVTIVDQGKEIALQVTDAGIGIPPTALNRLFKRFYRAGNVDPAVGGLGVGLFVVHEIVALHGGRLGVESTEGQGSTFSVYLPRHTLAAQTE